MFLRSKPNTIDQAHKQLGCSVVLQAIKDYFDAKSEKEKRRILEDLCSDWMILISDGMSEITARKLLSDPQGIEARIKSNEETEKLIC